MKKNRNKTFALFLTLALVMMGGMAFGQDAYVVIGGNVFGGGNKAVVQGNTSVMINQLNDTIRGDVYGGGALAHVNANMTVSGSDTTYTANDGKTTTVDFRDGVVMGNVYGGGLGDSLVKNSDDVVHALYNGKRNKAALVYGKVYVNIGYYQGGVQGNATINGSVFGCNNMNGTPLDSVFVNIYKTAHTGIAGNTYPMAQGTVTMDDLARELSVDRFAIEAVYGGGNKASYKPRLNDDDTPKCTTVHVWECEQNTIKTIYGGGNAANVGDTTSSGDTIRANTRLILDGGRHDRVFGGGNGFSSSDNHSNPYKQVTIAGQTVSDPNYNPGATIFGTDSTCVYGGLYRQVFGGSNQRGDIGTVALTIDKNCDDLLIYESFGGANEADITGSIQTTLLCSNTDYEIHTFYGGSNKADIGGNVTLNVRGGKYTDVFGGSKGSPRPDNDPTPAQIDAASADIAGNVTLNLHGGEMVNAFGGSDVNGSIGGYITVNVWDTVNHCGLQVDTIYGGGHNARYVPDLIAGKKIISPVVNLWNGTVGHTETEDEVTTTIPGCVFGGGKGGGAYIAAHPKVMIGDTISGHDPNNKIIVLNGNVFGGGNAAVVDGIDSVLMLKANSEVVNLFGGGNAALADTSVVIMNVAATVDTIFGGGNLEGLNGTALVDVSAGNVRGGIYGGSNKRGIIADDIMVNVTGGTIGAAGDRANIHGGGLGNATKTKGNVTVNFGEPSDSHTQYPKLYGDLYGGSGYGDVNDGTDGTDDITVVNILNGEITGDVYGGGLGSTSPDYNAKVNGKVFVNIGKDDNGTYLGKAAFNTYQVSEETYGGKVFGCNNANGSPQDSVFVNIFQTHHGDDYQHNAYPSEPSGGWTIANLAINSATQTYAIQAVYGGGNEAAFTPSLTDDDKPKSTTVHIFDCDKNTVKEVYGGGNAANVGIDDDESTPDDDETQPANTFVIIDGGRINRVFGGGKGVAGSGGVAANIYGTATTTISAGLIDTIFGGSNMNGNIDSISLILAHNPTSCAEIFNQVYGGANVAVLTGDLSTTIECGVDKIGDIYGGSNLANINGSVELNIRGGDFNTVFGGSKGASGSGNGANISGDVTLNLEGGTMVNAFGGSNVQGNICGYITVNVLDTVTGCGLQVDTIYGAGQDAAYTPNPIAGKKIVSPVVNLLKGKVGEENASHVVTVPGCVFGGGKGSTAVVTAQPKVIIGDTISAHSSYVATVLGNVFGGGNLATVDGIDSVLMLKSNSQVVNLFGGGNMAPADSTVVMMTKGIVDTIFGGGNKAGLDGTAKVALSGGTVKKGVYGGCNASGTVEKDITVNVTGGTVGAEGSGNAANVHGGGYGNLTYTNGDVYLTVDGASAVIWGDVYGGSAKGHVNDAAADKTNVTLEHGTIHGDLYGGGLGVAGTYEAKVNGAVQVTVNGGTVTGSVYGCNNANGAPQSTVKVDIYGTDSPDSGCALANVFGGGNEAAYGGTPVVTIHNCNNSIGFVYGGGNKAKVAATDVTVYGSDTIGYVFGGGNGQGVAADFVMVEHDAAAKIYGGKITHVFGGNNTSGKINGEVSINVDKQTEDGHESCDMKIGEVYGGGNLAAGNAGAITIGCSGTWITTGTNNHTNHNDTDNRIGYELEGIGTVYGGANQANVTNDIVLNIKSGIVENVFGGNNTSGDISGDITVNIEKNDAACSWYVGDVYGGGNHADYQGTPDVNIIAGTVSGNVYGGGNDITTANVGVSGSDVEMTGGSVLGGVYGGCNLNGSVTGNSLVKIYGGTVGSSDGTRADVFGGGLGPNTKVNGDVTVNINQGTGVASAPVVYGDVYGGSAKGKVNCNSTGAAQNGTAKTDVTLTLGTIYGNLYGGGLGETGGAAADVWGPVTVTVNGGSVTTYTVGDDQLGGNVYGCNNYNGTPKISTSVVIEGGSVSHDVFGGGNLADASIDTHVTINGGTVSRDVYGGGALAHTGATVVDIMGGTISRDIYGGGLGDSSHAPKVNGTVIVNIGAVVAWDPEHSGFTATTSGEATIGGSVYGCNNAAGSPQDNVTVNVYKTAHTTANEYSAVQVPGSDPTTYAIANVFGGGNRADFRVDGKTTNVNIYGCDNTIRRTFGGGNAAATNGVNTMIQGGRIYQVFGGGNGEVEPANIYDILNLNIHGGNVGQFYGASNQTGTITGTINVNVDNTSPCPSDLTIDEFFCGGNFADIDGDLETTISCSDGMTVHNLYGGCNQANISGHVVLNLCGGTYTNVYGGSKGDLASLGTGHINKPANIGEYVTLNLYGGTIKNVFGGSNVNGNIKGAITVNVIDDGNDCPLYITNLYGGSHMTNYEPDSVIVNGNKVSIVSPIVNVMNIYSNITGNVYGGSKGVQGTEVTVKANPLVNIGYETGMEPYIPHNSNGQNAYTVPASPKTTIQGSVFGGGDAAKVEGNTEIYLNKHAKVIGNVYGGGNMGEVDGDTKVIINGKRQ